MDSRTYYTRTILAIALLAAGINIRAAEYTFSFKNKSNRAVQIELIQQLQSITALRTIQPSALFTTTIDTNQITKMHLYFCPDDVWCKTLQPERMTAIFTPKKPIHISFDGKKLRPQMKRLKNISAGDIRLIK